MILVETFCDSIENSNTYLVINDRYAIIIDPSNDFYLLRKYLENKILVAVLLTHGHYDHFKKLEEILNIYNIPCYMHKNAKNKIFSLDKSYAKVFGSSRIPLIDENRFKFIKDSDCINIANFNIEVLYTPGHTDDSVCYIIDDLLFSGDTLFRNSVGRTDLITGDVFKQKKSIARFKKMKTNYTIYPGHDKITTLYDEQNNNPYFK